jgi:hypothetical protein
LRGAQAEQGLAGDAEAADGVVPPAVDEEVGRTDLDVAQAVTSGTVGGCRPRVRNRW